MIILLGFGKMDKYMLILTPFSCKLSLGVCVLSAGQDGCVSPAPAAWCSPRGLSPRSIHCKYAPTTLAPSYTELLCINISPSPVFFSTRSFRCIHQTHKASSRTSTRINSCSKPRRHCHCHDTCPHSDNSNNRNHHNHKPRW